ncbi:hypothetical protein HY522_12115 [bacterium]|nr:hypothetical protein [bacterium]
MKFKNPANNYVVEANHPRCWTLIFGFFYFLKHGAWGHVFLSAVLGACTFGLSWLIYPLFSEKIVRHVYLEKGWLDDESAEEARRKSGRDFRLAYLVLLPSLLIVPVLLWIALMVLI